MQESSNLRSIDLIAEEGDMHRSFQSTIAREADLDNTRQRPIKSKTWSTSGEQAGSLPARAGGGSRWEYGESERLPAGARPPRGSYDADLVQ
jgi:hypothetical protein